jgi:hypothetical protein
VAQRLGVHRNIIGHWLARYEASGLEALLAVYVPAGKPLSLPAIAQALQQPTGFVSYEALHQWVKQTSYVDVNSHTLSIIV